MKQKICLALALVVSSALYAQLKPARLKINVAGLEKSDSIRVVLRPYGTLYIPSLSTNTAYTSPLINSSASFVIPTPNRPVSFGVQLQNKESDEVRYQPVMVELQTSIYFLEQGDDIEINVSKSGITYSGTGCKKLELLKALKKAEQRYPYPPSGSDYHMVKNFLDDRERLLGEQAQIIKMDLPQISTQMNEMLRAEITGTLLNSYNYFFDQFKKRPSLKDSLQLYRKTHRVVLDTSSFNSRPSMLGTVNYAFSLFREYRLDSVVFAGSPFSVEKCYNHFKTHYRAWLRERLVTELLYENRRSDGDIAALCKDALTFVDNKDFRSALENMLKVRKDRDAVYNFSLVDASDKPVSLSRFKGKMIFLDFWFTGCGSCRLMPPIIKEVMQKFSGQPIVFLSVNIDKSRATWLKNAVDGKYTTAGEINLFTAGLGMHHPITRYFDITGAPTLILFDQSGKFIDLPDPTSVRADKGKRLQQIIKEHLAQ